MTMALMTPVYLWSRRLSCQPSGRHPLPLLPVLSHEGDQLAHLARHILQGEDLGQGPVLCGLHGHDGLVGLDVADHVTLRHCLTRSLSKLSDFKL